jgi:hypothetical protein
VPLKAGDKVWLSYTPGPAIPQFYGTSEGVGVSLGLEFAGPLNGVTPL